MEKKVITACNECIVACERCSDLCDKLIKEISQKKLTIKNEDMAHCYKQVIDTTQACIRAAREHLKQCNNKNCIEATEACIRKCEECSEICQHCSLTCDTLNDSCQHALQKIKRLCDETVAACDHCIENNCC